MRLKESNSSELQRQLQLRLQNLFCKDGYEVVELEHTVLNGRDRFSMVLFHREGLNLETCAELHKIAGVEIEYLQASGDNISSSGNYSLEVSSPGLGRRLRSRREFDVFSGQTVRCMVDSHWQHGTLLNLKEDDTGNLELFLETKAEVLRLPLEKIAKVELDK